MSTAVSTLLEYNICLHYRHYGCGDIINYRWFNTLALFGIMPHQWLSLPVRIISSVFRRLQHHIIKPSLLPYLFEAVRRRRGDYIIFSSKANIICFRHFHFESPGIIKLLVAAYVIDELMIIYSEACHLDNGVISCR